MTRRRHHPEALETLVTATTTCAKCGAAERRYVTIRKLLYYLTHRAGCDAHLGERKCGGELKISEVDA